MFREPVIGSFVVREFFVCFTKRFAVIDPEKVQAFMVDQVDFDISGNSGIAFKCFIDHDYFVINQTNCPELEAAILYSMQFLTMSPANHFDF